MSQNLFVAGDELSRGLVLRAVIGRLLYDLSL